MASLLLGTTVGGHAVIHAGNIAAQSVNYANSAGSVAWTNVSGRPTHLSQFTNDLGNYGNWITSAALANYLTTSQVTSSMISGLNNMLGVTTLPYSVDITVNGDPDRFYAVQFWGGDQDVWRRIIIKRGYSEPAPWDPIGTGVHHGGLLLDWEGNFGGWGGAEYADRIRVFNESYTNVCADMFIWSHSMGYVFMLRGGGAVYHLYSDQAINGFYQSGSPDILYSTSTLSYDDSWSGTNQYDVAAPAPLSLAQVNSSRIDGLRTKKQSLLDGRYLRQGVDISGIGTISSTNFLASNAYYLNGTSYYLNSSNGGIYTNARFESGTLIVAPGGNSSQWNTAYGWGNHATAGYIVAGSTVAETASWTGATKFRSSGDISNSGASNHSLQVYADLNNDAYMAFHISSDFAVYFGLENATNRLYTGGWSEGANKYQIWDSRDFSSTNISNWNTAYGWGNHASVGYLTSLPSHNHDGVYVPLGRTITINGVAQDLTANRSWTISSTDNTKLPLAGGTMSGRLTLKSISGVEQTVPNDFGAYLHLGDWGVGRTDPGAVLVNTAWKADALWDMNISQFTNNSGYLTSLPSHTHDDRYLPIGGGWYGVNLPGSRWGGYAVNGGEIVFGRDIPNTSQMSILVDGAYLAGENNGFWSLPSDNNWNGRRGMSWNGTYLDFTTNSPTAQFTNLRLANGFEIQQGGSNYGRFNSWVHLNGYYGLYTDLNGAHFYPNNGTYGSWKMEGSRNSYQGIEFASGNNGNVSLMINVNSNVTGFHNNSYDWQFYWSNGTFYVAKNAYGGGTLATVLDSSNFTSWAASASHTHDDRYYTESESDSRFLRSIYGDSGGHDLNVSGQHATIRFSTGVWANAPVAGNYSHVLSFNMASDNRTVQMYLGDVPGYLWWRPNQGGTWHPWERIWTSNNLTNLNQLSNGPGYITGYTETDTLQSVTNRGASTSAQVSFTKTDDHAIQVGTIRGRAVGSQSGEFIQLYERVNIGGPNGWGAANTAAPSYGLSVYGGANIGYGNSAGLTVTGQSNLNGQVYISRHIDANTGWGNASGNTIFVGWNGGKVVLGNGDSGGHDYARDITEQSIVSTNQHYFFTTANFNSNVNINGGINQNNIVGRPYAVWGAGGSSTGPVVIKFPGDGNNYGMVHAEIDIYEYNGNDVSTIIVGGHNWGSRWYSYGAQVIGQTNKQVRVGMKDGRYCIVIGDGSSSWSYGQVVLRKIQNGTYYSGTMSVNTGYSAAIESDSYSWISEDLRNLETPSNFYAGGSIYAGGNIVATQSWVSSNFNNYVLPFSYSTGINGSHVVQRDGNGYIYANHINFNTPESENPTISSFITSNGDGWSRKSSLAHVRNQLGNYGGWITSSDSISGNAGSASYASLVAIPDWRDSNNQPNEFNGNRVGYHFNNTNALGGSSDFWMAVQTVCPWSSYDSSHRQQQLLWGGSRGLSFRYATSGTTWSGWSQLYSDNYRPYADSAGNADTVDGYHMNQAVTVNASPTFQEVYANGWFRTTSHQGIYNPTNGAHFYPNDNSYGAWKITGSRNGWGGINLHDPSGFNHYYMHESGNGGYLSHDRWVWYHHRGNNSLGLGESTTSSSYKVYVTGSLYATGDIVAYSDRRKKTDIVTIEDALEKVKSMRGVFYTKIDESEKGRQVGVIAQEMHEVLPEAVTYASDVDEYGVKYGNIVGVLIEAIKEQQKEIEMLKSKIN